MPQKELPGGSNGRESSQNSDEVYLSVILPVFDEAESIRELIPSIINELSYHEASFEIVAVDDGSQDDTSKVLKDLRATHSAHLKVAHHPYNKGNGAALRTGSRVARGEILVYMDSDGQHRPESISSLISQMPPYDMVVGARTNTYKGSWYRNFANWIYNRMSSWLSKTEVLDLTSGFRAMRRTVANHFLHLYPSGFSTPTTVTLAFLKAGYNVAYIPVEVMPRRAGKSKIKPWADGFQFLVIIMRMITFYDPLRVFLPVGFTLTIFGILAWVAGVIQANRLVLPNSAIFLFISALLTWLLGLVSSQLASSTARYHGDETIIIDET